MRGTLHKFLVLTLLLHGSPAGAGGEVLPEEARIGVPSMVPHRDFFYRPGRSYTNYAFADYAFPDAVLADYNAKQNFYGPLGNFLISGFDVFSWRETRTTGHTGESLGSEILKRGRFGIFNNTMAASETHKGWAARLIIADELRSTFTPLTLMLSGLNGVRLDLETHHTQTSVLASRIGSPIWVNVIGSNQDRKRNTSLMFGGHGEVRMGNLVVGATAINSHQFDSRQPDFSLQGSLTSGQTLPSWLVVRFADDSPEDGQGGAVISEVRLVVNGASRPDLQPVFVRINTRNPSAVGRVSRLTGRFVPTRYSDEGTRFADFFYLQEHLRGMDVSRNVNLDLLFRFMQVLPQAAEKRADGEDMVLAYFDLSAEPYVRQVQVETLVSNDYRLDVVGLYVSDNQATTFEARFKAGGVSASRRSRGNIRDLSNLGWVGLDVGASTGRTTLGVNGHWEAGRGQVRWEYARSLGFRQYPDGRPGFRSPSDISGIRPWNGARSQRGDEAYYLTAEWGQGRFEGGGEVFSIGAEFGSGLVEDNDDQDRWPDGGAGPRADFQHLGDPAGDPDGVFPGKDDDHDGIPDTNKNQNQIPDYGEAFLLFEVEPDEYVYGRDWDHNGVADYREDDFLPDYPYNPDQRGYNLFGRVYLPGGLMLGLGQQRVHGISFGGRNDNTYALLAFEAERPYWGRLRAETLVQRVGDDIEDPFQTFAEVTSTVTADRGYSLPGGVFYQNTRVKDRLEYRNSLERQHYVEGECKPLPGLRLMGNVRHQVNHQRGGGFADGTDQAADRLSLTTGVVKAEYVWRPGDRWQVKLQTKGLRLRRRRRSLKVPLADAWTLVPILKVQCRVAPQTVFLMGMQGLPGWPLKERDRADSRENEEQEVRAVQLSSRSPYFGYQISTNMGVRVSRRKFEDASRAVDNVDVTAAFVKVYLGYE